MDYAILLNDYPLYLECHGSTRIFPQDLSLSMLLVTRHDLPNITCDFPQSSVIGLLLLIIYISPLCKLIFVS